MNEPADYADKKTDDKKPTVFNLQHHLQREK